MLRNCNIKLAPLPNLFACAIIRFIYVEFLLERILTPAVSTSISDFVSSVSWGSSFFLVSEDSRKELFYKHELVTLASQFYPHNLKMYVLDSLLMLHFPLPYWDVSKDVINHVYRYESESGDLDRVHMVKVHEANFVTQKTWPVKTKNLALKLN